MTRTLLLLPVLALLACTTTKSAQTETPAAAAAQPAEAADYHANAQPQLDSAEGATKAFDHKPAPGEKAICAVSGEAFTVTAETKVQEHEGKWYAFCCDGCAPDFAKDPAQYTKQ